MRAPSREWFTRPSTAAASDDVSRNGPEAEAGRDHQRPIAQQIDHTRNALARCIDRVQRAAIERDRRGAVRDRQAMTDVRLDVLPGQGMQHRAHRIR